MKRKSALAAVLVTALTVGMHAPAGAQALDHLQCFKALDALKLEAIVDVSSLELGLMPGCKLSRAAFVCVPASAEVLSSSESVEPVEGQPLEDPRVCYKVRCPRVPAASRELTDQFGRRVFSRLKTSLLCTPAPELAAAPETEDPETTSPPAPAAAEFQAIGSYGVPSNGYPHYVERAAQVLLNAVRMAPLDYRAKYGADTRPSMAAANILVAYPAVEPLRLAYGLNRAARYHSTDMAQHNCFQHASCNGTSWVTRIASFYSGGGGGENIAAGMADPRASVNALLCDSSGGVCCQDGKSCDYHRRNIMTARFRAVGVGYAKSSTAKSYWTQDFSGTLLPVAPPTPLVDGAHLLMGTTSTKFLANYRDAAGAPRSVTLVLAGARIAMTLDLGTARRGTFAAASNRAAGCRSYHFEAVDSLGRSWRYPASGKLRTYGEGSCLQSFVP